MADLNELENEMKSYSWDILTRVMREGDKVTTHTTDYEYELVQAYGGGDYGFAEHQRITVEDAGGPGETAVYVDKFESPIRAAIQAWWLAQGPLSKKALISIQIQTDDLCSFSVVDVASGYWVQTELQGVLQGDGSLVVTEIT